MSKIYNLLLMLICIFFYIESCNQTTYKKKKNISYSCYENDKKVIEFYIKAWIGKKFMFRNKRRYYGDISDTTKPTFSIDTIIYSDSLDKCLAIVINRMDTAYLDTISKRMFGKCGPYCTGCMPLFGYRKNKFSKWIFEDAGLFVGSTFCNDAEAKEVIYNFFFDGLKEKGRGYASRDSNNNFKTVDVGCTVLDDEFWSSVVWDSTVFKKGYFPFELDGVGNPIEKIVTNYPDSLRCY